jgi:hypothetical protein
MGDTTTTDARSRRNRVGRGGASYNTSSRLIVHIGLPTDVLKVPLVPDHEHAAALSAANPANRSRRLGRDYTASRLMRSFNLLPDARPFSLPRRRSGKNALKGFRRRGAIA